MSKIRGLVKSIDELFDGLEYEIDYNRKYFDEHYKRIEYIRLPCSFDIEVSSFRNEAGEKHSLMYIWMFGIEDKVFTGRTWEEFFLLINRLVDFFDLSENRILPVYVHNLAYEFQFIKNMFVWTNIFAREKRSPIKATISEGIEFRCSYMLSGSSLEQVGKNLVKYKVEKMVGDLDYDKIRTPYTELTDKEMGYCVNDCLVVNAYIKEQIEQYGSITKIPMTNTGRVREYCRNVMFSKKNRKKNVAIIRSLTIDGKSEYDMLKRAFQGGFTHANYNYVGYTIDDVQSFDFTSSYPAVMIAEYFPMSKGELYNIKDEKDLRNKAKSNCLIFNVKFKNIRSKVNYEHYISKSKCFNIENVKEDNGRIISADNLVTTITEVDYEIINTMYDFDEVEFGRCYIYKKGYLPKDFVRCIIDFYLSKTTLKDVVGMESEYQLKKGMLNSTFGMSVTDIVNDIITFEDDWKSEQPNFEDEIERYNKNMKRFLFYPWGVYITAYARRNLFYGINECKEDYIYSDTDSIKIKNAENHIDFIKRYNEWITKRLQKAAVYHKINVEDLSPKTVDGKVKPLGIWDDDGRYNRFKTLGSKRYLVEFYDKKEDCFKLKCTVAGLNKKQGSKFIESQKDPFKFFNDFMTVDEEHSGRKILQYIDKPFDGVVRDYKGNLYEYHELSGINMEGSDYNLKLSPVFRELLNGREEYVS